MLRDKTENINDRRVTSHRRPTARRKKRNTQVPSYYKRLQLPAIVDSNPAKTSYKNGVLQIKLQKTTCV